MRGAEAIRTQVRPVPTFQIKQQPTQSGAINSIPGMFQNWPFCVSGIS